MTSILRNLEKLTCQDPEKLAGTSEDMKLLLETLNDLKILRTVHSFLCDNAGLNLNISPEIFYQLLDISEINIVETQSKTGELDRILIKEIRHLEDPVSVANLNTVLRELNHDLTKFQERMIKDFTKLLLIRDITNDRIESSQRYIDDLKALHSKKFGYLFSPVKVNRIEKAFQKAFPNSIEIHLLRSTWHKVERELELYKFAHSIEERWSALSIDLFEILKTEKLTHVLQNIQEIGSLFWNLVYNGQRLGQSLEILEIHFGDIRTVFENKNVK